MNKPRGEHEGAFHHVFNHAVADAVLFRSDADRQLMLTHLERSAMKYGIVIHAYTLMDTHIHLLLQTPEPRMGEMMQHFKSCFTKAFNRIHGRRGALFGARYRSEPIETDAQLKEVHRYVHNNPVKAGMVKRPEDHPWSSMAAYMGTSRVPRWLDVRYFLELFQGRKLLRNFTSRRFAEEPWDPDSPRESRYTESFVARHFHRPLTC